MAIRNAATSTEAVTTFFNLYFTPEHERIIRFLVNAYKNGKRPEHPIDKNTIAREVFDVHDTMHVERWLDNLAGEGLICTVTGPFGKTYQPYQKVTADFLKALDTFAMRVGKEEPKLKSKRQ